MKWGQRFRGWWLQYLNATAGQLRAEKSKVQAELNRSVASVDGLSRELEQLTLERDSLRLENRTLDAALQKSQIDCEHLRHTVDKLTYLDEFHRQLVMRDQASAALAEKNPELALAMPVIDPYTGRPRQVDARGVGDVPD